MRKKCCEKSCENKYKFFPYLESDFESGCNESLSLAATDVSNTDFDVCRNAFSSSKKKEFLFFKRKYHAFVSDVAVWAIVHR